MTQLRGWAVAVALLGQPGAAQDAADLERRVAAARDGEVRLTYAARPGVVGNGRNVIAWDCDGSRCRRQQMTGDFADGKGEWGWAREPGPVRVALRVRDGSVVSVRVRVGGTWRAGQDVTDLGTVAAPAAAAFLLRLARGDIGRPAKDAIFAAALADSATIWRALLAIARDRAVRNETRKQAVFWLGQEAEQVVTRSLDSLAMTDDESLEVREAAVFALSQRPAHEGVPALIRIARTHQDSRLRRRAMFWLAQSTDPRALELFEQILSGK